MSDAAERVRAYLQARAQDKTERSDAFRTQGIIARQGEHYLREADLESLLPPENPHSPALEVHDTWFSARTPDNRLYIETRDPQVFRKQCAGVPDLVLRKHTVYRYGTSQILKSIKEVQ